MVTQRKETQNQPNTEHNPNISNPFQLSRDRSSALKTLYFRPIELQIWIPCFPRAEPQLWVEWRVKVLRPKTVSRGTHLWVLLSIYNSLEFPLVQQGGFEMATSRPSVPHPNHYSLRWFQSLLYIFPVKFWFRKNTETILRIYFLQWDNEKTT